MHARATAAIVSALLLAAVACDDETEEATVPALSSNSVDAGSGEAPSTSSPPLVEDCDLTANTKLAGKASASGCELLDRDTSSCRAAREGLGLAGTWLAFSCRVTLGVANGRVTATFDGQPDYASNYFTSDDTCHEDYTGAKQNPNLVAVLKTTISFPQTPGGAGGVMRGAIVGVALNGVPIFGNFAAPGDDIYTEAITFDRCAGHPQMQGVYHYHSEPYALTNDDGRLVGAMIDGSPVYGRRDADGSLPTLDEDGGHTSTTAESPTTPVYHYHVNEQMSVNVRTAGQKQWFLTKGRLHNATGTCSGSGC